MNRGRKAPAEPVEPTVELRAEKLIGGGRALAHHEGETWMVAGALPGELVAARMTRRRAGIVEAETVAVKGAPNPSRDPHPCPHSDHCGGCDWPHIELGANAAFKRLIAADAARGTPDLAALLARAPVVPSPLAYRLRARLHWDPDTAHLGFYESRSNTVAEISACRILSPQLMAALPPMIAALTARCPRRIDVEWLEGSDAGDAVAGLRPGKYGPQRIEPSWIPQPDEVGNEVRGFHLLDRRGEVHGGWGATAVQFDLPALLKVPIGAFFQGNRHLIAPLFKRVSELAGKGREPVYDLHAGVGFLAAAALSHGARDAFLVEPDRVAARAAALNLPNATVAVGRTAEEFVGSLSDLPRDALVITDPPRAGLTKELRRDLVSWQPRRVLMLGCDPATWTRDAAFLSANGYRVGSLEIFDLFPSTHHVEILALLERT